MARPAQAARKPSNEIFTVSTLVRYPHCHPRTVDRLLKNKQIPGAFKLGSDWRFRRSAIDQWIARLSSADVPRHPGQRAAAAALARVG